MKRIFISLPYSDSNRGIVEERILYAQTYFLKLTSKGYCPVAPILVGDPIVQRFGIDNSFDKWKDYCYAELLSCDEIHVLKIDGYDYAHGVNMEIKEAELLQIPIYFIEKGEINE